MIYSKMELSVLIIGLLFLAKGTTGSSDIKSSLTFVIDDTGSMADDIYEVKVGAKAIFDTVMNSNTSQIEDFVLVTINDPTFKLRKKTKDANVFKEVLDSMDVDIGPENEDCPELSMSGIELALQSSKEGSSLYVFTDASAKDYEKYDAVEALSQKMGCRIVFVLTGVCKSSGRTEPQYLVYQKLAEATNGQVFHLKKNEIGKILEYVKYNIEGRKQILTSKSFPGGRATFDIAVDADTKELVIAVSAKNASISVTDSGGTKWPTTDMTRLSEIAVVKVIGVNPDIYTVEVGGDGNTHVVVSGSTSVHFQHGFSTVAPSAITDTVRRPVPGEKSHLSIKLVTEGGDVELKSVQILDMNDTVILEKPLKLVNDTEQFHTTIETITPPDHMFKIAIKAYDVNTQTFLTRISLTPVKPQEIKMDTVKNKAPVVACKTKVTAPYGKALQLNCRITGFPKPDVTWDSDDKSAVFSHFESTVELPYDYISVLDISDVKSNATYSCKASNIAGNDHKMILVDTKIVNYFKDLVVPNDTTVEYQKSGEIPCVVEAYPPASVSWYKSGNPLRVDENIQLSANGSVLRILSMEPYLAANYICEAVNSVSKKTFNFKVDISGVEAPEINKTSITIRAVNNSRADIRCQVTKGTPTPTIHWYYKEAAASEFKKIFQITETIHFDKVTAANAGTYRCIAQNILDWDHHEYRLIVESSAGQDLPSNVIELKEGTSAIIPCRIPQKKSDKLQWFKDGQLVSSSELELHNVTESDAGTYTCRVSSVDHTTRNASTRVEVGFKPRFAFDSEKNIVYVSGKKAVMDCTAAGVPEPKVKWYHDGKEISFNELKYELQMNSSNDGGRYICVVNNIYGTVQQEFAVSSFDCSLDLKNNFGKNSPLILVPNNKLTHFKTSGGFMYIPKDEIIRLVCPSNFNTISLKEITLTCEHKQEFTDTSGRRFVYSDLKCTDDWRPLVKETRNRCTTGNSEMLKIGFETRGTFQEVYEVCLDRTSNNTIYTKLAMQQPLPDFVVTKNTEWFDNGIPVDLNVIYDCGNQNAQISTILNRGFHGNGCCFKRRMLVNPLYVTPGLPQATTYTHLNVAPHWGTCNTKHWEEVERRVRNLVTSLNRTLQVWTGTAEDLLLPDASSEEKNVILNSSGKSVQVPRFFWKVIQDSYTAASLVVVQVNVPDLKLANARKYMLCTDVCKKAAWMRGGRWRNVNYGYTYCCSLADFQRAFRYYDVFPNYTKLLMDV